MNSPTGSPQLCSLLHMPRQPINIINIDDIDAINGINVIKIITCVPDTRFQLTSAVCALCRPALPWQSSS